MRDLGREPPDDLRDYPGSRLDQVVSQVMDEGIFYGLFFAGILLNYVLKLNLEKKGNTLARSNVREGVIMGVSTYLLYQVLVLPGIPTPGRVVDALLGVGSLIAGGIFFVKGRLRRDEDG